MKNSMVSYYVLLYFLLLLSIQVSAQSTSTVYSENFNSGNGGWVIGGYNSSWSYGVPTLPNIISNGSACFATGDAGVAQVEPFTSCLPVPGPSPNGNFYNCCERSYVESPSINLTGINSPLLSLDINLFCEQTYDGSKVQLSVDGGNTWDDIGSYNSGVFLNFPNAVNCREQNWYNKNNINYLTGSSGGCTAVSFQFGGDKNGWSGGCSQSASGACTSPDNHGTNGWVTSTHCIQQAANKSNVKIRVAFGAGSQVFTDGIAFDNVRILNVYPVVNFNSSQVVSCDPEITFVNTSDCAQSWNWNFGHPGSPGNSSTDQDPVHVFPSPGSYQITLNATDFCGGISTFTKTIQVNDGVAPKIDSVTTSDAGLCNSAIDSLKIYLSSAYTGTTPYTVSYLFDGSVQSQSGLTGNPILITGLQAGIYSSITILDLLGCEIIFPGTAVIPFNNDSLVLVTSNDTTILAGGSATLMASTNIPSTFSWNPITGLDNPLSSITNANPENTTTYTVTVIDSNGCTGSSEVVVNINDISDCKNYFIPNSFTPNGDSKNETFEIIFDPSMRIDDYQLVIYNRWGGEVFNSNTIGQKWEGREAAAGTYAVNMNITCRNKKKSNYTGTLRLIR